MATKLPTVAIIGRANAGKSSLFNRMMRSQQAIVAREAGTTRDRVVGKAAYHGHEFWLVDTAGLKPAEDEFEASIQEQITDASDAADVILVVVDSTEYPSDEDRRVAKTALKSRKPVILIANKTDLRGSLPTSEFLRLGIKSIIHTSAEHNSGISDALDEICQHIPEKRQAEPSDVLKIAVIGRPNVGKSSLFNTLASSKPLWLGWRAPHAMSIASVCATRGKLLSCSTPPVFAAKASRRWASRSLASCALWLPSRKPISASF